MRILLIEDNAAIRGFLIESFRRRGFEVTEATNGQEGFRKAWQKKFDLIVLDLLMPEWDGFDAAEALALTHPDSRILVLSGYLTEQAIEKLEKIPIVKGWMDKPVNLELLDERIQQILGPDIPGGAS